jgi:hypothetical protein
LGGKEALERFAWSEKRPGVAIQLKQTKEELLVRMNLMKLTLGLATLALGIASAASSYDVKLYDAVWIGSTQLKAGAYKVEVQGNKAVFKSGKNVVEVPATMGTADKKFDSTSFVSEKSQLLEIDLGGTTSKIVFSPSAQNAAGSK